MLHQMIGLLCRAAVLLLAGASLAHAHHVMDYATPATALEGLLSGLGHPVIGIDHLLFIAAAGVLAARLKRGFLLPLVFVVASVAVAGMRYLGVDVRLDELWIAGSLVVLGAIMLAAREPSGGVVAGLFLVTGALHGYALAEAIVGAERTPLALRTRLIEKGHITEAEHKARMAEVRARFDVPAAAASPVRKGAGR